MTHVPKGQKSTSIHHISVVKGSPQSAYRFEILNREFMFSDQLATVISGLYGPEIAEHTHFYVDNTRVNRQSLLDDYQGKNIHVYYDDHIHDPDRIGSLSIPVLEPHQMPRHHATATGITNEFIVPI